MKEFENWRTHKITISENSKDYKNDSQIFYELLKTEHSNHMRDVMNEKNPYREINKIKSPMTIFNGNWGSGKTFFIENFMNNFNAIKEENKYFDEYLYLDALELISSENIVFEALNANC